MKYVKICVITVISAVLLSSCGKNDVDTLTYAIYPYLPDAGYYQELIERRWSEAEPDIKLVRAEWDCYGDSSPDGIDVIMYDAVVLNDLVDNGWIRPIEKKDIRDAEDCFSFALDGLTVDDRLYGIPVFFCGNFLIYDTDCAEVAGAGHLTDLSDQSEILVINSHLPMNRPQYIHEVMADTFGVPDPTVGSEGEDHMSLIDRLAIDDHEEDEDEQVARCYDSGTGKGYIGFSESIRLLDRRLSSTGIKTISFSSQPDLPRLYVDAVAVTGKVEGIRYEKCLELINVIAEAEVLSSLSVQNGAPQYLMLARRSAYENLKKRFPLYEQVERIASDEKNRVILGPRP